jgi:hypothetical protein
LTISGGNKKKWAWALVIPVVLCFGPGAFVRWKIEQAVKEKLPDMIGPARSYTVSVKGGLFEIIKGHIAAVNIRGNGVRLANGLTIDRLDIRLQGIKFKPDQTITDVQSTDFAAVVTEQGLSEFLTNARPDMKDSKISLADNRLTLSASLRILATRTPVTLECSLRIDEATKLNLVIDRLIARGVNVPGFVRGKLMHDLNPVFDTQQMGIDAKLRSVQIANGAITLTGNADVKGALAQ